MNSRLLFVLVLLAVLLVLAGCNTASGNEGSPPAPSATTAAPITTTPTTSTTTVPAQVVHVTISDQRISADHSTLYANMPYHFVVTNTGKVAYQFMMGQGEWQSGQMPMGQGGWHNDQMPMGWWHQMTPYRSSQITPGTTMPFDYTFPASAVGPHSGFGCYQQGRQGGMWYPFTIQPHP